VFVHPVEYPFVGVVSDGLFPSRVDGIPECELDSRLLFSVADDGPGIPELEQHVIESGTETPLNHSLGVGLWVMEWVATTLGGELTIADNEPRGSVVTFQLPDV
jgi:sensor histidine kinase regulating citrate/malate metabolism